MRWEDERYCRLYTRDTATWTLLPWQARCLLPLLLRKLDRAGTLDVLAGEEAAALAGLLQMPTEVVEVGLAALIGRKVVVLDGDRLLMPNFMVAQECSQSDKVRKQTSRERAAQPRATPPSLEPRQLPAGDQQLSAQSQPVTDGHKLSHEVTDGHSSSQLVTPSRAVPCLAVPSLKTLAGEKPPAKDVEHQAIIDSLVTAFEAETGTRYAFSGRDAKAVKELRGIADRAEIEARWRRALKLTHPPIANIHELPKAWNRCARDDPSKPAAFDFDQGIIKHAHVPAPPRTPPPRLPPEMEIPL